MYSTVNTLFDINIYSLLCFHIEIKHQDRINVQRFADLADQVHIWFVLPFRKPVLNLPILALKFLSFFPIHNMGILFEPKRDKNLNLNSEK